MTPYRVEWQFRAEEFLEEAFRGADDAAAILAATERLE